MNTPEKLAAKRQLLLERTASALGVHIEEARQLFGVPRQSSFRINTLKVTDRETLLTELVALGWRGNVSTIYEGGYSIEAGRNQLRDSQAIQDGLIFIQNQASWLPVLALNPQPGEKILDLCAAPGGKATHIAELTNNQAELWVNDNSRARLYKLRASFSRLGAHYNEQTMYGIDRISHVLEPASFDKILLDAPCSGEGLIDLMRDKDFEYWSLAQIKRLQQLQKKAITAAWRLLKPGGTLVYSTCTMAPEENEGIVDYLLSRNPGAELQQLPYGLQNRVNPVQQWGQKTYHNDLSGCCRLQPSADFEAFFVAKIFKRDSIDSL